MKEKRLFVLFSFVLIASMMLASCAPAATPTAAPAAPAATEAPAAAAPTEAPAAPAEAAPTEAPAAEAPTEAPAAPAATEPQKGGQLVYVEPSSYYTLDPFVSNWHSTPQYSVYDTGASLKPDFSEYVGVLFESWESAADNLSVTCKVRPGVKFQDGTAFDAAAFKWNWDRYLDEKLAAPQGGDIRDNVKEVKVVDDMTVEIVLKNPYAPIYSQIANVELVSPTAYEKLGPDDFARSPVGAGPWKVKTITENTSILYERYEDYNWGPSYLDHQTAVYPDSLLIKYIPDESVRFAALETGEVHISPIPPQFLEKAKANKNITINEGLETGITYLGFNNEFKPLDDEKLRAAIGYVLNRDELIQVGYEGEAVATYGPLSPAEVGYSEAVEEEGKAVSDDIEKAKSMLDEAGYKEGADGVRVAPDGKKLEFTLDVSSASAANQRMAETIQAQLQEVGISLKIESIESQVIKEKTTKGTHEMILWNYSLLDPSILTYIFHSSRIGASNRNRVNDPELDKLIEAADQELNAEARNEKVAAVSSHLVAHRYHIPLLTVKAFTGYRSDIIAGVKFDKAGTVVLQDAYLLKK